MELTGVYQNRVRKLNIGILYLYIYIFNYNYWHVWDELVFVSKFWRAF